MSGLLLLLAYALAIIGGIMVLIAAFQVSLVWGLAVLLLPGIVHLIFIVLHWQEAKRGVLIQLCAIPCVILAHIMSS